MKILSWNVNGLRAVHKKGFLSWLRAESPDILCLQEIKAREDQLPAELLNPEGYRLYLNPAARPGYSGVAVFTKKEPLSVKKGLGIPQFDEEGRVLEVRFSDFTLLGVYFPNGQRDEERRRFKLEFHKEMLRYLRKLRDEGKKVLICGDYNIAHRPVDLEFPDLHLETSGFLPEERAWVDELVAHGFVDTFRLFNSNPRQYTWWDLRTRARERNEGWRIDYHFVTLDLKPQLREAFIMPHVTGSDHCPVGIILDLKSS